MGALWVWIAAAAVILAILVLPRLRGRVRSWDLREHRSRLPHRLRRGRSALVGARGLVLQDTGRGHGRVRVAGETWAARCPGGELEPGTRVEVVDVRGATALVEPVEGEDEPRA